MSQIDLTLRVKLTKHWDPNWLNIESQIDSTLRVKLTQHGESNWFKYSPVTHFARSHYNFASHTTFKVKMTQFFLSLHWEKKLSQFDLKSWIKFKFRQWLNFLGQNDSIFFNRRGALREKLSHFDLKSWYYFKIEKYFKIEILAIRDEFVTLGHKGLTVGTLS